MKTHPQSQFQRYSLLVLVPHIEARASLKAYSAQLFAAGCNGAWSFPWVVPLATLAKPLSPAELKQAAMLMRELSLAAHESGKFTSSATAITTCTTMPNLAIFGPTLNIAAPNLAPTAGDKLLHQFNPLVAGSAIVQKDRYPDVPPPPTLSFRAAAVANMAFSQMPQETKSGYSWQWEIEKLYWLPKVKRSYSSIPR